jgi:uncharacterized protein
MMEYGEMRARFVRALADLPNDAAYYVYRLIDPRNGLTFYVGKGKGGRVFDHVLLQNNFLEDYGEENWEDMGLDIESEKVSTIQSIHNTDLEVQFVIHRHGMSEEIAFEVEAALMDSLFGLSNVMGGHGSSDRGPMHPLEIIQKYDAEPLQTDRPAILININRKWNDGLRGRELYNASRFAWVANPNNRNAGRPLIAIVHAKGLVRAVYENPAWFDADDARFMDLGELSNRRAFEDQGWENAQNHQFVRKSIRDFIPRSAQNPIQYMNA